MTPRTETGKRLWPKPGPAFMADIAAETRRNILAIEAEAARQERERLRAEFTDVLAAMPASDTQWRSARAAIKQAITHLLAEPEETP